MPHGVRSHRSSQDNLTRTSIQGTLAGRNRAGHTSRRTNSHRSHQDHSRSDLASRDALAGRNRAGHTSRRTNSRRSHQDLSRSDLASRDALAGCGRAGHTSRRSNSHRSQKDHPRSDIMSTGPTCLRQTAQAISGNGSIAPGYRLSWHGSGLQDHCYRTLPTL
jgi:hypothetical protein